MLLFNRQEIALVESILKALEQVQNYLTLKMRKRQLKFDDTENW